MVPIRNPPASLVTQWGTWLGPTALVSLLMLALQSARNHLLILSVLPRQHLRQRATESAPEMPIADVDRLTGPLRFFMTVLKAIASLGLVYLALTMLRNGWRVYSTHQIYVYLGIVLLPLLLNWLLTRKPVHRVSAHFAWLDHAGIKFGVFPLLMALPAFRLHQVISFGSTFGEYLNFGALAYLQGLAIWWASWSLGLMLWAAVLRLIAETLLAFVSALHPDLARHWRGNVELIARLLFYLAVPIWFGFRVLA